MTKYACMILVFVLGFAAVAFAQATLDTPYQVRYITNVYQANAFIRIVNTGARGASVLPSLVGAICANVYGFATTGQMVSCCNCLVRTDGLVSLSVWQDLLPSPTVSVADGMVIKLLASVPVGGSCGTSAASVDTETLTPGLVAWTTTPQPAAFSGFFPGLPETRRPRSPRQR